MKAIRTAALVVALLAGSAAIAPEAMRCRTLLKRLFRWDWSDGCVNIIGKSLPCLRKHWM